MNLKKIEVRYYPPGINIIYEERGRKGLTQLNTYSLASHLQSYHYKQVCRLDVEDFVRMNLIPQNPEMLVNYQNQLCEAVKKIQKNYLPKKRHYKEYLKLKVHKQPLTNCGFSKYGDYFATSSYDRTCKLWDSNTGNLISTLTGHRNAVFCMNFSHFSDQTIVATGSFDQTVRLWGLNGKMHHNLTGHTGEITSVKFNPNGRYLCSSSLDSTARVWDIETGKSVFELKGHEGEVINLEHNYLGDQMITCSFDKNAIIWDLKTGQMIKKLQGHNGQINCCKFQYTGQLCATGSSDRTCIIWDIGTGSPLQTFEDAEGDILDLDFNRIGNRLVTGSTDSVVRVYNVDTSSCTHVLRGHQKEITRVKFNPEGDFILSTGFDGIGRIWDTKSGRNIGLLQGHQDQIFSCDVSYYSKHIITCSKDNSCIIWKDIQK